MRNSELEATSCANNLHTNEQPQIPLRLQQ